MVVHRTGLPIMPDKKDTQEEHAEDGAPSKEKKAKKLGPGVMDMDDLGTLIMT